jgi:glutathione peroxidase
MNTKLVIFAFMAAALMFALTSFRSKEEKKTLYDFKVKSIDGKDFDLSTLKGKKVMVVNTASLCGFTPQYADLEKLYQQYGGEHFTIIGFPANNFGSQEPGSNSEIHEFCTKNYSVTFQMMEKISVKGDDMHPLYQWLTEKTENGVQDAPVQWNFQKFLIDENGNWAGVALSKESPLSDRIVNWIKGTK